MARAKKAPVVKSVIIEGAPVIERAIVRFSHIVLQFTVENGDQISYEVLETLDNPEVADAIEYATVRFSEVVCQFVVTDGTTVHAYELEPVYQEIGGSDTRFAIEYQGNLTAGSTDSNRVTLISDTLTLHYGETLTLTIEDGYKVFLYQAYGNPDISLNRTVKQNNQIYIYAKNISTEYVYATNDVIIGWTGQSPKIQLSGSAWQWVTASATCAIQNSTIPGIEFGGLGFMIAKNDDSAITINEAKAAVSWNIE